MPWLVKPTAMVNHCYIYVVERDFGPFFLKFCTYLPHTAKLCLDGHEYAKRQLAREGIAFQADNGVQNCADPQRLQQICDGLSAERIEGLLRKRLAACRTRSPPPTTRPATVMRSRSCRPSSRSPGCSIVRSMAACSSNR